MNNSGVVDPALVPFKTLANDMTLPMIGMATRLTRVAKSSHLQYPRHRGDLQG
ncbi:hypothetical protein [Schaalia vaccimaxillae]|uniref:hypothetical protein n=1 Tax=Schaalia vaccimaxillae TaxID=183916 RepID=UPI0003B37FF5|nr:hypothetical protein [Schaalia vaccimaxillae]